MTILDTIDNAISDWETSADAMRWTAEPPAATGGIVTSGPDIAGFVDAAGLALEPWQRRVLEHQASAQVAAVRLAMDLERVRLHMTVVATQFAEAMKGVGAALRPLFDEVRWGQPKRPARVSQIRRAYRAKRRHW